MPTTEKHIMTTKVTALDAPHKGWRYHSGTTLYTERFRDGRLIAASLQATGIPVFARDEDAGIPAFDLQIDGESLYFGWELADSALTGTDSATPGTRLVLRHTLKPVELEIVTIAGGDGFFRRRMRLTNTSPTLTLGLTSVSPLTGQIWPLVDNHRENLHESGELPYKVGRMMDVDWGTEGNFQWQDVPLSTEIAFNAKTGRSGHSTPFVIAHNNSQGGYFVASLAWSANWRISFTCNYNRGGSAGLMFAVAPTGPAPMRMLAPGESTDIPEVHFGLNYTGFDDTIQCWHRYLRRNVLPKAGNGLQPIIYNHWGFMEHEMTEPGLIKEIDIAAEIGAELFMVDAGWYADANTPWGDTSGDWQTGNRLPNDLFPVFAHARAKGLKCGLWVEVESAGKESKLAKDHPDWFIARYGAPVQRVLDLAKPVVRDYVEATIFRLIEKYQLEMFRLDYNLTPWDGGFNACDGRQENTLWRHNEAIYAIFDKVRQRYPNLQLENCSSGGGRTDLGMMGRFTTTWISDWMRMPRTVRILNGMSLALPPEYLDRLYGCCMAGSYRGSAEIHLHLLMLCHPTVSGLTPSLAEANPELLGLVKKYFAIYKTFIRPFHRDALIYHHTPTIAGADASGWCALEHVAADRSRAVAGVFRLVNAREDTFVMRFRGLDPARTYRVTSEPGSLVATTSGFTLQEEGLKIRLDTPLTSRLLLCEAVG
jgi:alpha-galactosidase